jgi:hypothetical protein
MGNPLPAMNRGRMFPPPFFPLKGCIFVCDRAGVWPFVLHVENLHRVIAAFYVFVFSKIGNSHLGSDVLPADFLHEVIRLQTLYLVLGRNLEKHLPNWFVVDDGGRDGKQQAG